jgi:hypothetical protein
MVVAHGLKLVSATRNGFNHLDANRARLYRPAHDQRHDHIHRPSPPHFGGMGGRLRVRLSPLPPDPVRGIFLLQQRDLIRRLLRQAGV